MPRSAEQFFAAYGPKLKRELAGRHSRLRWRRRRAYRACLTLIRAREALVGFTADPWLIKAPPKPAVPARPTYREV